MEKESVENDENYVRIVSILREIRDLVKPTEQGGRVWRWLHKHNRLLTVIGAGIVLTTFTVKDGIKERLRDLVGSIGSAESIYVLEGQGNGLLNELKDLEGRTAGQVGKTKSAKDVINQFNDEEIYESNNRAMLRAGAEAVKRLQDKGGIGGEDIVGAEAEFEMSYAALKESMGDFGDGIVDLIEKVFDKDIRRYEKFVRAEEERGQEVNYKLIASWHKLRDWQGRVWKGAEERRAAYERKNEWATRLTYVLYPLGWLLGLIGTLAELKGVGAKE